MLQTFTLIPSQPLTVGKLEPMRVVLDVWGGFTIPAEDPEVPTGGGDEPTTMSPAEASAHEPIRDVPMGVGPLRIFFSIRLEICVGAYLIWELHLI